MITKSYYGLWENEIINVIDGQDFIFTKITQSITQANSHFQQQRNVKQKVKHNAK
jgi:hypothetical protein